MAWSRRAGAMAPGRATRVTRQSAPSRTFVGTWRGGCRCTRRWGDSYGTRRAAIERRSVVRVTKRELCEGAGIDLVFAQETPKVPALLASALGGSGHVPRAEAHQPRQVVALELGDERAFRDRER